jgi:conjugative transfer signal peptidase TraF
MKMLGWIVGGLVIIVLGMEVMGLRINTSRSIPLGLYRQTHQPLARGEYVLFCPPPTPLFFKARQRGYISAGFCPGELGYMMKKIAALPGDKISISAQGVTVKGKWLTHSQPLPCDGLGRSLPQITFTDSLKPHEILLMTNQSDLSFDSRYFGPLNEAQIKGVIKPLVTW